MASQRQLSQLDLHPRIKEAARRADLATPSDILKLSQPELMKKTGLSEKYADLLIGAASLASLSAPDFVTAASLKRRESPRFNRSRLSVGCPVIDAIFEGGVLTGTITEITGESSSGKTQLCLQLSIRAQLPEEDGGLDSEVAFISTEEKFPYKRFEQLSNNLTEKHPQYKSIKFTDNVHISYIKSIRQLLLCFKVAVSELLERNIKLFVIDSIANLLRSEYEPGETMRRTNDIQCLGREIWKLANEHNIAVVCVNQVTTAFGKDGYSSSKGIVLPTLGLLWANVLTTRVMVARTNHKVNDATTNSSSTVRLMRILFSSYLPNSQCYYIITENGIIGTVPSSIC